MNLNSNLNSEIFDCIRVKGKTETSPHPTKVCAWKGCAQTGLFPAPGANVRGKRVALCREHVIALNRSYDFFRGKSDQEIRSFQRDALFGNRPTWKLGARSVSPHLLYAMEDCTFGLLSGREDVDTQKPLGGQQMADQMRRPISSVDRKALATLGLNPDAEPDTIKSRFKAIAKRHHPDLNGGDKSGEDKLKSCIRAYAQLKKNGLC